MRKVLIRVVENSWDNKMLLKYRELSTAPRAAPLLAEGLVYFDNANATHKVIVLRNERLLWLRKAERCRWL
jgi:hypothetical protein